MSNLLTNRTFLIDKDRPEYRYVTWYSALHYLMTFKSVVHCDWINTCSSAGDWEGYLVQRINGINYLIPISQDNNYPRAGYTLYTSELLASWQGEFNVKDSLDIYSQLIEETVYA